MLAWLMLLLILGSLGATSKNKRKYDFPTTLQNHRPPPPLPRLPNQKVLMTLRTTEVIIQLRSFNLSDNDVINSLDLIFWKRFSPILDKDMIASMILCEQGLYVLKENFSTLAHYGPFSLDDLRRMGMAGLNTVPTVPAILTMTSGVLCEWLVELGPKHMLNRPNLLTILKAKFEIWKLHPRVWTVMSPDLLLSLISNDFEKDLLRDTMKFVLEAKKLHRADIEIKVMWRVMTEDLIERIIRYHGLTNLSVELVSEILQSRLKYSELEASSDVTFSRPTPSIRKQPLFSKFILTGLLETKESIAAQYTLARDFFNRNLRLKSLALTLFTLQDCALSQSDTMSVVNDKLLPYYKRQALRIAGRFDNASTLLTSPDLGTSEVKLWLFSAIREINSSVIDIIWESYGQIPEIQSIFDSMLEWDQNLKSRLMSTSNNPRFKVYLTLRKSVSYGPKRSILPHLVSEASKKEEFDFLKECFFMFTKSNMVEYANHKIHFRGQESIDAGGLTREVLSILSRLLIDPQYQLLQPTPDGFYLPNPLLERRIAFFISKVVGKCLQKNKPLVMFHPGFLRLICQMIDNKNENAMLSDDLENSIVEVYKNDFNTLSQVFDPADWVQIKENQNVPCYIPRSSIDDPHYVGEFADEKTLIFSPKTQADVKRVGNSKKSFLVKNIYCNLSSFAYGICTFLKPIQGAPFLTADDLTSILNPFVIDAKALCSAIAFDQSCQKVTLIKPRSKKPIRFEDAFKKIVLRHLNTPELVSRLLRFATGSSLVSIPPKSDSKFILITVKCTIPPIESKAPIRLPISRTCFNLIDVAVPKDYQTLKKLLVTAVEGFSGFGAFE